MLGPKPSPLHPLRPGRSRPKSCAAGRSFGSVLQTGRKTEILALGRQPP